MQSTGKEKFTVYIYFKTQKYDERNPWSESDSEYSSDDEEIQNSDNKFPKSIQKSAQKSSFKNSIVKKIE